jgi:hypothetical protein
MLRQFAEKLFQIFRGLDPAMELKPGLLEPLDGL